MTDTATRPASTQPFPTRVGFPLAVVLAAVVSVLVSSGVAAIAHAAGASDSFKPLQLAAYAPISVIGLVIGAAVWLAVRARAADPRRVLGRLVPAAVLVSLVPDVALGVSQGQPHTTWGAVVALMVMHLVVAAAGVTAFHRLLPLPGRR